MALFYWIDTETKNWIVFYLFQGENIMLYFWFKMITTFIKSIVKLQIFWLGKSSAAQTYLAIHSSVTIYTHTWILYIWN